MRALTHSHISKCQNQFLTLNFVSKVDRRKLISFPDAAGEGPTITSWYFTRKGADRKTYLAVMGCCKIRGQVGFLVLQKCQSRGKFMAEMGAGIFAPIVR